MHPDGNSRLIIAGNTPDETPLSLSIHIVLEQSQKDDASFVN
jgi:hypothetical protein